MIEEKWRSKIIRGGVVKDFRVGCGNVIYVDIKMVYY